MQRLSQRQRIARPELYGANELLRPQLETSIFALSAMRTAHPG